MLIDTIKSPVVVFNIDDFGIDKNNFIDNIKQDFDNLSWDMYDLRRMQLNFIRENVPFDYSDGHIIELMISYYLGVIALDRLDFLTDLLSEKQAELFKKIKPYRKRSISEFQLTYQKGWSVQRIPSHQFAQLEAKIDKNTLDYRYFPRVFSETHESAIEKTDFQKALIGVASLLKSKLGEISSLNMVVHHTYVEASEDQVGDNSPEGIHQDGYDYIVSALVVERKDISGAVSQIFGADKKTPILATRLLEGQGILQPDKNTSLWHNVTSFSVSPGCIKGHRSSIGFDINIVK